MQGANFTAADLTACDMREGSIAIKDRRGNINLVLQVGQGQDSEQRRASGGVFTEYLDARETIFIGTKMINTHLRGANFQGAILERADLSGANMQGAKCGHAMMRGAKLEGVDIAQIDLKEALTDKANGLLLADTFQNFNSLLDQHQSWIGSNGRDGARLDLSRYDMAADGMGYQFANRTLTMMKAQQAVFYRLGFTGANIQAADMQKSDCRLAQFDRSDCRGIDFKWANLMRANFQLAKLNPLILAGGRVLRSDLSGANLRYADFTGADLREVQLKDTDLSHADLRGANLLGTDLTSAILQGTLLDIQ
jgi:uncharacterized protein YjbI with pentapeptide repeats